MPSKLNRRAPLPFSAGRDRKPHYLFILKIQMLPVDYQAINKT